MFTAHVLFSAHVTSLEEKSLRKRRVKHTQFGIKMALCSNYSYCVVVCLSILLSGVVSDEQDSVYEFLSWKLEEVLNETKKMKLRFDNVDDRIKNVEEKLQGLHITTSNPINIRIRDEGQELETEIKKNLNMQALSVRKMLLKQSAENINIAFAVLISKIHAQTSVFYASLKEEVKGIGKELDNLKSVIQSEISEYNKTLPDYISDINATFENNLNAMYEIINNNSLLLIEGIAELTSDWNLKTDNISQTLQALERNMVSNTQEFETKMSSQLTSLSIRIDHLEKSK